MPGYRLVDSKEIARGGFLTFSEETFESPAGERFVRWIVEHPGAVAAVPVEPGPDGPVVIFVRQWRPVMRDFLLEIPAGKLDVPGEDPEAAKEEEQDMTIERFPLADVGRLIATGEITDAKTIIGLTLAERYLVGKQPPGGRG